MSLLDAALSYAGRGWAVFPLKPRSKKPATAHGFKDATRDVAQIQAWWTDEPEYNIGIATGEVSNLVVIDPDADGNGTAKWAALAEGQESVRTLTSMTGAGGHHWLFEHPGMEVKNNPIDREAIHVRADGGYIVAPPSIHPDTGRAYQWVDESVPVSLLPAWLINLLEEKRAKPTVQRPELQRTPAPLIKPPPGYAARALQLEVERVYRAPEGDRNNTLNRAAFSLGQLVGAGLLDRHTVEVELTRAGEAIGLSDEEIRKTIYSGIEAGIKQPRQVQIRNRLVNDTPADATAQAEQVLKGAQKKLSAGKPTDDELADEWSTLHEGTAFGIGEFRRYGAGIWSVVPLGEVEREITQVLVDAKSRQIKPSRNLLGSVTKMASVLTMVPDDCWDANFDVLVCQNGTLHIPTMTLRDHAPEDYQTYGVPYAYDPAATCPTFLQVLHDRIPDQANLVQEFAGLALTTDTRYEIALWFYGPRGSGKSTIIEGITTMLGERAGLLGLADIERSQFALADLPGKTLVVSTEQPGGFTGATHIINKIISGEPVTVERKYKNAVTIIPRAKVLWAMNELPRVNDSGDGIFRRVQVIKFPPSLAQPDAEIKERVKQEGAGILNWALAGLQRLRVRGRFVLPESVKAANQEFELKNDIPKAFVDECCDVGAGYSVASMTLYASYKTWCENTGHRPQSTTSIAPEWERLGFTKGRNTKGMFWAGLQLKAGPEIEF